MPYEIELEAFLADFRVGPEGVYLGSVEPRNPAARIGFFEGDSLRGSTWHFLLHPEMPVGDGPDVRLRLASYQPLLQTGLELATHPGAAWVWGGFALMTLGTLLSFLLRHERLWLRVATRSPGAAAGLSVVHSGGATPDPARAIEDWEGAVSILTAKLWHRWPGSGGSPDRWPRVG
jgi:hypothetical protein